MHSASIAAESCTVEGLAIYIPSKHYSELITHEAKFAMDIQGTYLCEQALQGI